MFSEQPRLLRPSRTSQLLLACGAALTLLVLSGCGGASSGAGSDNPPPPAPQIVSVQLLPGQSSVPLGRAQQFTATAKYSDGSSQDVTSTVAWSSADSAVATVSPSGLATSKSVGNVMITASLKSVAGTASLSVTPAALTSIAVDPPQASLPVGANQQFIATGTYTDGSHQDLTRHATWRSSAPEVASVTPSGLATGNSAGNGNISASFTGIAGLGAITVTNAALISVDVFPDAASIAAGNKQRFTAIGNYSDGSQTDLTRQVAWTSSAPEIATINPLGVAKGKVPGKGTITAALNDVAGSGALKVTPAELVSIEVNPQRVSVLFGKSQQFSATGTFTDGSKRDLTSTVAWSSSSPQVANVSPAGLANTKDTGTTNIAAAQGGLHSGGDLHVLPVLQVNYFDNVNGGLGQDATVRVTHPGSPHADLCAMLYVFDEDQQITECCGCATSPNGLRTFSVERDLTGNPLTGTLSTTGTIKVISADARSNPRCNAASFTPKGALRGWSTHIQAPDSATVAITEGEFQEALLTPDEQAKLQDQCRHIQDLGSGHGICSCGKGD